jgi:hypothetical protein
MAGTTRMRRVTATTLREQGIKTICAVMDAWNDEDYKEGYGSHSKWVALMIAEDFANKCCEFLAPIPQQDRLSAARHLLAGIALQCIELSGTMEEGQSF